MTIQQFLSPTVREWVNEMNEKNPHISHDEFCKLFEEWFEKNEKSIVLNESVDMSQYCRVNEAKDDGFDFDDFEFEDEKEETEKTEIPKKKAEEPDPEPADPKPEPEETKKVVVDDDDEDFSFEGGDEKEDEGGTFKDVEGGDKEVKEKPITIAPMSEEESEKVASKIKGKYLVNNGEDYEHNIFNVVNAWYDDCIKSGSGENLQENNRITLLDTAVVDDMRALFAFANVPNLDLSGWDTSAVVNMEGMFYKSTFDNPSILDWDVSMCINFKNMFDGCRFSHDVRGRWTPGKILKIKYDDYGRPKMVHKKDSSGEDIKDPRTGEYIWEPEKVRVDADLPEIGMRKHGVHDVKNRKILAKLRELDSRDKEAADAEKEKRVFGKEFDENYNMKNIVDFDTFVNEGFVDKIKSGLHKVKDAVKALCSKVEGYYVALFKEDGSPYSATSKFTTLNYVASGKVPGVMAYSGTDSTLLNKDVKSKAQYTGEDGTYEYEGKDSNVSKNYVTLMKYISEHVNTNESLVVEGEQMSLSSKNSGVEVMDITTDALEELLKRQLFEADAYVNPDRAQAKTLLIYGAPGIGKSSIPKAIINAYNKENPTKKKALLTIQCGDLTLDGFYLPIPAFTKLGDRMDKHTIEMLRKKFGEEEVKRLGDIKTREVVEAPKTWLPVYTPSSDMAENIALNAVANGRKIYKTQWDEEAGEYIPVIEETTEGGIIMFDEFLRADPEIFKILMQIVLNRETGDGKKFGSKWAFVCCSNRPVDDNEVKDAYNALSVAAATRFLKGVYNFIPDFYEWKKWAETKGHFDEYTLEFISRSTPGNKQDFNVHTFKGDKPDEGVKTVTSFKNWHNVDLDDPTNFVHPMPRTWSALMESINQEIEYQKVESILDLPMNWIRDTAAGVIGEETAEKYVNYLKTIARHGGLKVKDLFTEDNLEIDTEEFICSEVTKRVEDYINLHYYRRDGEVKLPTDREIFTMTKNMDKNYGDNAGSFLVGMHTTIVQKIFKIRSTDSAIISKLKNYLKVVSKKYGVEFADGKAIEL